MFRMVWHVHCNLHKFSPQPPFTLTIFLATVMVVVMVVVVMARKVNRFDTNIVLVLCSANVSKSWTPFEPLDISTTKIYATVQCKGGGCAENLCKLFSNWSKKKLLLLRPHFAIHFTPFETKKVKNWKKSKMWQSKKLKIKRKVKSWMLAIRRKEKVNSWKLKEKKKAKTFKVDN